MITDLISLTDFFEQLATDTEGIEHFLALSNGEKAVDEISAYYTNDYAGCTLFFQVAEAHQKGNQAGLESLTFLCSMTVAMKPDDTSARADLLTRDFTQKILLKLIGKLRIEEEASQQELQEAGEAYEFSITPAERMFPIGLLANVNLAGYYIDVDITIPVNTLLYPNG
jgi:hypothetical protein